MFVDDYVSFFPSNTVMNFPRFRQLPAELRLKIWQDTLPGPRTIQLIKMISILQSPTNTSEDQETFHRPPEEGFHVRFINHKPLRRLTPKKTASHCITTIKCPKEVRALLHTCRESRLEALSRYQPLFAPKSIDDPLFGQHYFDPSTDGIFIDEVWPWVRGGHSKPTGLFNARILSISCNAWSFGWKSKISQLLGKGGLLKFTKLEELHIVFRILTDDEREQIMKYRFGQYMGPGDMTHFLRRRHAPHDLAFPDVSVDIKVKPILERFEKMKAENPTWNIPKVKLIAWATRSTAPLPSSISGDVSP